MKPAELRSKIEEVEDGLRIVGEAQATVAKLKLLFVGISRLADMLGFTFDDKRNGEAFLKEFKGRLEARHAELNRQHEDLSRPEGNSPKFVVGQK